MKWSEYNPKPIEVPIKEKTDIECPNCGKYIFKYNDKVLCSNPPQYLFKCDTCGWEGYSF